MSYQVLNYTESYNNIKEESEKAGLKFNIRKKKIMATSPITSWQTNGEIMQTGKDYFLGLQKKITADGDCSHGIKRCLHLGRKAMTNVSSIVKSRDITLLTKVHIVLLVLHTNQLSHWSS